MEIINLSLHDMKELFSSSETCRDNGMIGKYVIVRCHDAGVHAGILDWHSGREAILTESRRLWYWKANKGAFLSGVALYGLSGESKVGAALPRIHLTETCEIILCSKEAAQSIKDAPNHNE